MTVYGKHEARAAVKARLSLMTDDDYQAAAGSAYEHTRHLLAGLHGSGGLHTVSSYRAAPKWREVDLSPLEREFGGVRFDSVPADARAPFPAAAYDAVLVPLYGFSDEGYRLGHGAGWYDTFLAMQPQAYKIGIGLQAGRIDFVSESHDIPVDVIVTEQGLLHPKLSGKSLRPVYSVVVPSNSGASDEASFLLPRTMPSL